MRFFHQEVLQLLRNLFTLSFNGRGHSTTTLLFEGEIDLSRVSAPWRADYEQVRLEARSLGNSLLAFGRAESHFGVKNAFYGLEVFPHRARFNGPLFSLLQGRLFDRIIEVR